MIHPPCARGRWAARGLVVSLRDEREVEGEEPAAAADRQPAAAPVSPPAILPFVDEDDGDELLVGGVVAEAGAHLVEDGRDLGHQPPPPALEVFNPTLLLLAEV